MWYTYKMEAYSEVKKCMKYQSQNDVDASKMHAMKYKKTVWRSNKLYNSSYVTFWRCKTIGTLKISGYQEIGVRERVK
jgi:hypothetical protein